MEKILIAGGSGLIGAHLSDMLSASGYEVNHLSRKKNSASRYKTYVWDIDAGLIEEEAIRQADYIINLAGAGIADKPWTAARKKLITGSRVNGTRLLRSYLEKMEVRPKAYLSSTAIGYYGDRADSLLSEDAEAGTGFLSESTIAWEKSISEVAALGIRTVGIRIGIVLSTRGGALEKMLLPLKFGLATYFGNGKQWYSWIHIEDIASIFKFAIEEESLNGFYNGVGPQPARNKDLASALQEAYSRPSILLPAPAFALRLGLGEMADAVLYSTKVSADKIQEAGYHFKHPALSEALSDLLLRKV
jgi:uncharacterized protein (TIGR01777 family)